MGAAGVDKRRLNPKSAILIVPFIGLTRMFAAKTIELVK
jgi:hypothetical protein